MIRVSATELRKNFSKYLKLVQDGEEIVILKNGKEVARLISHDKSVSFLSDSLVGILKNDYSKEEIREERLKKYESVN